MSEDDWREMRARFREDCQRIMKGYVTPPERPDAPFVRAGRRMADYRRARGLSLRALEKVSGYSHSILSEFELAHRSPTKVQRENIAQALGVEVDDIWW